VTRILTVVGARPQFVKAAAVSRAIVAHNRDRPGEVVEDVLVHTGQHYDHELSAAFFAELELGEPDHYLGVGPGPSASLTAAMVERLEPVVTALAPDVVVVHGDTNSTVAGATVAARLGLRLAHVEAGMRTGRLDVIEEVNRVATDRLATDLFCPSPAAVENLAHEGIRTGVTLVGDVMIDALLWILSRPRATGGEEQPGLPWGGYGLATVHRAENTDDPARLRPIMGALGRLAADGLPIVMPLHPRTRRVLGEWGAPTGMHMVPPCSHQALIDLARGARVVLTDSGGLQKEAYWLGVPCVTLRDETEWVETVVTGWNVLAGCDHDRIVAAAGRPRPPGTPPPLYGDGGAAKAVVRALLGPSPG